MVIVFCPACGTKVFVKGVPDGTYPIEFRHYGHLIRIELEGEKAKEGEKA